MSTCFKNSWRIPFIPKDSSFMGDYSKILSMSCCVYFDYTLALLCETCLYLALLCKKPPGWLAWRYRAENWLPVRKFFMTFWVGVRRSSSRIVQTIPSPTFNIWPGGHWTLLLAVDLECVSILSHGGTLKIFCTFQATVSYHAASIRCSFHNWEFRSCTIYILYIYNVCFLGCSTTCSLPYEKPFSLHLQPSWHRQAPGPSHWDLTGTGLGGFGSSHGDLTHTVDGSEIPRPTTWDGAKTL